MGAKFGHIVTEVTRQKLREAHKHQVPPNKGRKWSDDFKQKVREGMKRAIAEGRARNPSFWTGKEMSTATKQKMSLAHKDKPNSGQFKKGQKPWNTGKPCPQLSGPNNPNWKGGITTAVRKRVGRPKWMKLAKTIYKRDNWCCRVCGVHCRETIQCHHIKPVREGGTDEPVNLVTLCRAHHLKIERSKFQDFWAHYFRMEIKISPN